MNNKIIIAAALGECVHIAGIMNFLRLAELTGWRTVFLGPAVPVERVLQRAKQENASMIAVSYRLTPETGERLVAEFAEAAESLRVNGIRFLFAGTPPLARRIEKMGFFERIYSGGEPPEEILSFLKGQTTGEPRTEEYPQAAVERINWKAPFPLLRHHFGQPTMQATVAGTKRIAEARILDVISLGIDQDAQENFFHPERQDPRRTGAGGVPVRTREDYNALYAASRFGNFPLLRVYSGTDDFIRLAEMYVRTINNAWAAVPIFWFNQMDGRGPWDLEGSIREHQKLIAWYGKRDIPVELNEAYHWGMRDGPDVIYVVTGFLSAYNAHALGVSDYICSMMFNSPHGTSDLMDLAKMAALLEMIKPLAGPDFRIWRQVRTGLLSYPLDVDFARAHLATSVYLQMALKPHIIHVVGHTEAQYAATAQDVIEACKIARTSIEKAIQGQPQILDDSRLQKRKMELIQEAKVTLEAIRTLGRSSNTDPLTNHRYLTEAVTCGILDAPQLQDNRFAKGKICTMIDNRGACVAINPTTRLPISEVERLGSIGSD